jgi:hypothetical protein
MIATKEYVVTQVLSPNLVRIKSNYVPTAPATIPLGTPMCSIGFRPISGTSSAFVDTLSGSLAGASATLTLPPDVASQKVPGLFWRDQTGKVSFLPAPVNGTTGLINPNLILKTPNTSTAGSPNLPTFVPIPGGYTWLPTPSTIASFTLSISSGGPTPGSISYDVGPLGPAGAKMVILDINAGFALVSTSGGASVDLTINGFFAARLNVGNSFGSSSDTNQIIVPIESSTVLTLNTVKVGSINNSYSQTVRVLGFIG